MKYFCEACERLVPPASYRLEFGLLVLKCSRCKVEMRCGPDAEAEPVPAPAKSKSAGEPVIQLGQNDAEPDPIEVEPTRRIAVPPAVLAAIENEARDARRKAKEAEAAQVPVLGPEAKTPVPEPEPLLHRSSAPPVKISVPEPEAARAPEPEPVAAKSPAPAPEAVAARSHTQAPEPVAARSSTPAPEVAAARSHTPAPTPRLAMSEAAAASNLMVLRLSDVKSRTSGAEAAPASTPAPAPVPISVEVIPPRVAGVQLRVVPSEPSASPAPAAASPSPSPSSEDPFMPPAGHCPKCIGPRKDGVVCPFCGLEYARFRIEEHRPSPAVASTWLGVLELWESKGPHDKVLALASERGELAGLGRLYRIQLARNPDDTMAKRGREEVLRLASAGSALMPSEAPDKRAKLRMAGLGLLFLFLLVAAVLIGAQVKRMLMSGGAP